jgi:hypothetical protein
LLEGRRLLSGDFDLAFRVGSSGGDLGSSIAADSEGNVFVAGRFAQVVDFDPGPGVVSLACMGDQDVFVAKYTPTGGLLWARRLGSFFTETSIGVAVDPWGNAYVTGWFSGTVDFDPSPGVYELTSAGSSSNDFYLLKLDSGGGFVWARRVGANGNDYTFGIAVDGGGNVLTTGIFTDEVDFDPGTAPLTALGGSDVFVSKLDRDGSFAWARHFGGALNDERGNSIAVDPAGSVCVTGQFSGTADFDPGPAFYPLYAVGGSDIFVSKLDRNGDFIWAKQMGGLSVGGVGSSIAVDSGGNALFTGTFQGTADFDPGAAAFPLTSAGGRDIFVSKLDGNGNLIWARRLGGAPPRTTWA